METKLNKLELKIDTILEKIEDIHRTLDKNTDSLIIHEKRTDLAEHKLAILERELEELRKEESEEIKAIHAKLEPVATHVKTVNWILTYFIPAMAALVVMLYKLGVFDSIIKH